MQESSRYSFSGFPLEFTPYLIRGGNDETSDMFYAVLNNPKEQDSESQKGLFSYLVIGFWNSCLR